MTGARRGARLNGEQGDSGPLEVVILAPVLLLMFALVVAFGRASTAATDVQHAARVGARAAVAAQSMAGASSRAQAVVDDSLARSGLACVERSVGVAGALEPGGRLTVTVRCVASLADITRYGLLPGARTLTASASEPIDRTRGGG